MLSKVLILKEELKMNENYEQVKTLLENGVTEEMLENKYLEISKGVNNFKLTPLFIL